MKKDIGSLRSTLEYLEAVGELVTTDVEVDPHLEVAAIQKHFDGGAALLFNKVKGYPNARICNNIFANAQRIARLLDVDDPRNLKHRVVEALRDPLPPVEVKDGPCQEVVLTKSFDVWDVVPMISHSDSDPGRTLGAGTTVVRGKHFWGGSHIGYNRMNFRGPDYSSFQISPGSHMDQVVTHWYRKGPIPVTINIGIPPTSTMMAGSGFTYVILPRGCDELGVAGALQGAPVELVRARTQDAWSIASAEYVIEGYIDTTRRCGRARSPRRMTCKGCTRSTRSGRGTSTNRTGPTSSRRRRSPIGPTGRSTTASSGTAWPSTSSTGSSARRASSSWPGGSCRASASTRTSRWG